MCKEYVDAATRELEEWPGTTMTQEQQGKHPRLVLHYGGQSRIVVMSATPSDIRGKQNHIATVRRELRGMGAQKAHVVMGKPKVERPFKPHVAAVQKPFEQLEEVMSQATGEQKIKQIMGAIGDLRYGEMLLFAGALSNAAVDGNMRRNRPDDWARMLQNLVEAAA